MDKPVETTEQKMIRYREERNKYKEWYNELDEEYKDLEKVNDQNYNEAVNPLAANVAFSVLLWLTPDDFTRQWETSWPPEG